MEPFDPVILAPFVGQVVVIQDRRSEQYVAGRLYAIGIDRFNVGGNNYHHSDISRLYSTHCVATREEVISHEG